MREPPRVLTPKNQEYNGDSVNTKAEIRGLPKPLQMWVPASSFLTSNLPAICCLSLPFLALSPSLDLGKGGNRGNFAPDTVSELGFIFL